MANIIDAVIRLRDNFTPVLENARKGLSKHSKEMMRLGRDIDKIGKNISNVGNNLTLGVTTPLAGFGLASIKTAGDFEQSMSKVQALSMASTTQMEALRTKAIELGASTKFSASESAQAMQYMAMASWGVNDILTGLPGVMNLAAASGEDLATVSDIVTDAMTGFKMSAGESARFADVLARSATNSNTNVYMMGETFKYVSPIAGAFKYTVEDSALAIGLMANSGIKASQAGTSLRTIMSELSGTIKITGKNLGNYTYNVTKADGTLKPFRETMTNLRGAFSQLTDAEKVSTAEMLVGKEAMSGLLAIVNASDEDFEKLANSIDNSKGAAEEMAKIMQDNLWGQFEEIGGAIETISIRIGEWFLPTLKDLSSYVQNIADKFSKLSDEEVDQIIKIGLMVAAIGPAVKIFGKLVRTVGKVTTSYGKFAGKLKDVGFLKALAIPGGKVVLIMTAIALVALLVIKNWDKIKPVLESVYNFMKGIWESMGIDLGELKQSFEDAKNHIGTAISTVKQFISDNSETISNVLTFLKDFFIITFGFIGGTISGFVGNALEQVQFFIDGFNDFCDFIGSILKGEWEDAWKSLLGVFENIFGGFVNSFTGVVDTVKGGIRGIIDSIKEVRQSKLKLNVETEPISPIVKDFKPKTFQVPNVFERTIPTFAKGTSYFQGGLAQVNEKGGEIIDLKEGSRIIPHDESLIRAKQQGRKEVSTKGFVLEKLADTIIVREDADIDRIANALYNKFMKQSLNMA